MMPKLPSLYSRSLKTRLTILTLGMFLVMIWMLAIWVSYYLRGDLQRALSAAQVSAVTAAAATINAGLESRLAVLDNVAKQLPQNGLGDAAALQRYLDADLLLRDRFNAGAFIVGDDGTTLASVPSEARRVGVNYADRDFIAAALQHGKATIGRPILGKVSRAPYVVMAAPIRDARGRVVGALAGATDLSEPNFIAGVANRKYGDGGGYLVIAPQYRLIVTGTDKTRIMQPLARPNTIPAVERMVAGELGSVVFTNSKGVEQLLSAEAIPVAGWFISVAQPTAEVFYPVYAMQRSVAQVTLLLTLLAAGLVWWMLKRQLAPLAATVSALQRVGDGDDAMPPLPVTHQDEIGEVITRFDRLLQVLHRSRAELRDSEAFKRAVLDSVASEIVVLDRDGVIIQVNEPWRRFAAANGSDNAVGRVDVGSDYLVACQMAADLAVDGAQRALDGIHGVLNGFLSAFSIEYPCHSPTEQRWFSMTVTPLLDVAQGGVVIEHSDISERERQRQALQESENRFVQFMDRLPAVAFIKDESGDLVFGNRSLERFHGIADWRDKRLDQLFPAAELAKIQADDQFALANGSHVAEEELTDAQGEKRHYQAHKFRINRQGRPPLLGGIAIDVTEQRRLLTELQLTKIAAEKANNAKSRFLAAASHDLRQPLAALSLYVGLLKKNVPPGKSDMLVRVEGCVTSLSAMLTDILDVSKLDAGVVSPKPTDFDIDEVLEKLVVVYSVEAELKGLRLRLRSSGMAVRTDRQLMQRILDNLVANAIRFTDKGGLLIACRRHKGKHWIEVWDSGIGIPADKTEVIFEEFRQLGDDARNRGSGLGLAIVAKTAALLGLQIRLHSRPGRGSMFAIELPLGQAQERLEAPAGRPAAAPTLTIAVVEDNPKVLDALVLSLESHGYSVIAASSGKALLARVADRAPDILITDYRLAANETGYEVIVAMRRICGEDLPAIVITGDTDPALIRVMADRGIALHYKPIQIEDLLALIAAYSKDQATDGRARLEGVEQLSA